MKYLIIPMVLFLTGCSWFQTKPIEVTTTPVEKIPLILPEVDIYRGRPVEWIIVTPDNYQEVVAKLRNRGSVALFALTAKDYENASLNRGDIFKLVRQLQDIIDAYQDYYANELTVEIEAELSEDELDVEPVEDDIPEIE